mmetsp:Transcript_26984/g.59327  ORF Transcript_26984/g.59327 Transcript_26984/m.59327 type:complete len:202 (-) Transcript_26984:844-1449(-)
MSSKDLLLLENASSLSVVFAAQGIGGSEEDASVSQGMDEDVSPPLSLLSLSPLFSQGIDPPPLSFGADSHGMAPLPPLVLSSAVFQGTPSLPPPPLLFSSVVSQGIPSLPPLSPLIVGGMGGVVGFHPPPPSSSPSSGRNVGPSLLSSSGRNVGPSSSPSSLLSQGLPPPPDGKGGVVGFQPLALFPPGGKGGVVGFQPSS